MAMNFVAHRFVLFSRQITKMILFWSLVWLCGVSTEGELNIVLMTRVYLRLF